MRITLYETNAINRWHKPNSLERAKPDNALFNKLVSDVIHNLNKGLVETCFSLDQINEIKKAIPNLIVIEQEWYYIIRR